MAGSTRGLQVALLLTSLLATTLARAAPTVNDNSYAVNVNGLLSVDAASGLLSNDTGFNAATHRLESTSIVSQYGARLAIAADGSFTLTFGPEPEGERPDNYFVLGEGAVGGAEPQRECQRLVALPDLVAGVDVEQLQRLE